MRCEGDMVLDRAVMPDMVSAPKDYVVPQRGEWLNCIVFQDEAIISDLRAGEHGRLRADVADQVVALCLDLVVDRFAQSIHCLGRHRRKKAKLLRRMGLFDLLEPNYRQTFKYSARR